MPTTRRDFLKFGAVAAGATLLGSRLLGGRPSSSIVLGSTQIPQTPLPGKNIPKYVDPLPNFVGARVKGTEITVSMHEFQEQVLPASVYASLAPPFNAGTYVWGYKVDARPMLYPGFTIEATRGVPTTVTYVNSLPISPIVQKYITVDQSIHWANPLGLSMDDSARMMPFQGPPPAVAHLHGGEVPSAYDGGPDSWFTPGLGITGPGFVTNVYTYPNEQEATTLWFHDHALGATRLNVYAGLAAFYFLRDQYDTGKSDNPLRLPAGAQEIEIAIQDRQFDTNGQWFFPDDGGGFNGPPPNPQIHPFWIPEFFGDAIVVNGKTWPYLEVEPRRYRFRLLDGCNARMLELRFMNSANGGPGPDFWQIGSDGGLLDQPVRLSNSSNPAVPVLFMAPGERADIIVDFAGCMGETFILINGAKAPYPSGTPPDPQTNRQIMQFRVAKPLSSNDTTYDPASGAPLRGGIGQMPAIIRLTDPAAGALAAGVMPQVVRQLTLIEVEGPGGPVEVLVNNTKWDGLRDGTTIPVWSGALNDGHGNYLTELPQVGSTEVWEIVNLTMDAHPIHLHLVQFQLLNRQNFQVKAYRTLYDSLFPAGRYPGVIGTAAATATWGFIDYPGGVYIPGYGPPLPYDGSDPRSGGKPGGNPDVTPFLRGRAMPPDPNEIGWKDTFKMYPGQVTRIVVRWAPQDLAVGSVQPGQNKYGFDPTTGPGYVWHCHIVDHEDNEMMRPYKPRSLTSALGIAGINRVYLPTVALDGANK